MDFAAQIAIGRKTLYIHKYLGLSRGLREEPILSLELRLEEPLENPYSIIVQDVIVTSVA